MTHKESQSPEWEKSLKVHFKEFKTRDIMQKAGKNKKEQCGDSPVIKIARLVKGCSMWHKVPMVHKSTPQYELHGAILEVRMTSRGTIKI